MKKMTLICSLALAALLTACGSKRTETSITAPDKELSADSGAETAAGGAAGTNAADAADNTNDLTGTIESIDAAAGNTASSDSQIVTDNAALPPDSIGPVSLSPNSDTYPMVLGSSTLNAYFQRPGVIGAGRLTLYKASDDSVVEEIDLADPQKCAASSDDSVLTVLGWKNGTRLAIRLKKPLTAGESYYVTLAEGAFKSSDKAIASKKVDDKRTWSFDVAKYGVKLNTPSGSQVFVDDVLTGRVILTDEVDYVKILGYDENRVRFNEKEFEESSDLEIKIHQIGEDSFTLYFYDHDDDIIGSVTISYTASMRPDPKEELKKPSVSNL